MKMSLFETTPALETPVERQCACGKSIARFSTRCGDCIDAATIAKATIVEPDEPLCIVGTDTFFAAISDATDGYAGQFAHPCDRVRLSVNPQQLAAHLAEQAAESMCEEAYDDAYDDVNGGAELEAAIKAALVAFNDAQTAYSWEPRTGEVFQIPGGASLAGAA